MNFVLDALVVVVFALCIVTSARKGFARSVLEIVGYFAALFIAGALSVPVGGWIYRTFLTPFVEHTVTARITSSIRSTAGAVQASAPVTQPQIDSYIARIPSPIQALLTQHGVGTGSITSAASQAADQSAETVGRTIAERVFLPIAEQAGKALGFLIVFLLCLLAVRLVVRAAGIVSRLPVLRTIDRAGGAVIGVAKGLLVVFLLAVLLSFLVPMLAFTSRPAVTQSDIDGSTVFRFFYEYNPVSGVLLKK